MSVSRHTGETLERSLRAVLAHNPAAAVGAFGADGRFIEVPGDLLENGHSAASGRWVLDLLAPDQIELVTATWSRAVEGGAAHAAVRLVDGSLGTIHYYDTRATRGAMIVVIVPGPGLDAEIAESTAAALTPRHAVVIRDDNGFITSLDDTACALLRCRPEQLIGQPPLDLVHPEDLKRAVDNWIETVSANGGARRYRGRHRCGDGTWLWLEFTNHIRSRDDGSFDVVSEMVDISEEMAMHEALREREEFLRRLTAALPVAVGQLDGDGRLVYANDRLDALLHRDHIDRVDVVSIVVPDQQVLLRDALRSVFDGGSPTDIEVRTTPHDSATARVHRVSLCALHDDNTVTGALVCLTDVTESADLREALRRRATFDDLTGLHNRASILMLLGNALLASHELGMGAAVIFVDLDRFKGINDELGHAAGDDVLVRLARRLREAVRQQDLVGRIGGDEFLVVCPEVREPSIALDVAERVSRQLSDDLDIVGTTVRPRASIGVAWSADPRTTPESLIRAADAAMYESKRSGTGRPVLAGLGVGARSTRHQGSP